MGMYRHKVVTTGTVTVPDGWFVHDYAGTDDGSGTGTITITPANGTAQDAIPLQANETVKYTFGSLANETRTSELGGKSTIAFANTVRGIVVFCQ